MSNASRLTINRDLSGPMKMRPVTIPVAARRLGVHESTLRRWIAQGAPVAKRGGRGRGKETLINVEAIRAWRSATKVSQPDHVDLISIASRLPEIIAECAEQSLMAAPDKRGCPYALLFNWQLTTGRIIDLLREIDPTLPEPTELPESVERLKKIAHLHE